MHTRNLNQGSIYIFKNFKQEITYKKKLKDKQINLNTNSEIQDHQATKPPEE